MAKLAAAEAAGRGPGCRNRRSGLATGTALVMFVSLLVHAAGAPAADCAALPAERRIQHAGRQQLFDAPQADVARPLEVRRP